MTDFLKPSFSVNPSGAKAPAECRHGWTDKRGKCVMCGERVITFVSFGPVAAISYSGPLLTNDISTERKAEGREWKASAMFPGWEYCDIPHGRLHRASMLAKR